MSNPIPLPPGYLPTLPPEAQARLTALYPQLGEAVPRLLLAAQNALAEMNYTASHPAIRAELETAVRTLNRIVLAPVH